MIFDIIDQLVQNCDKSYAANLNIVQNTEECD